MRVRHSHTANVLCGLPMAMVQESERLMMEVTKLKAEASAAGAKADEVKHLQEELALAQVCLCACVCACVRACPAHNKFGGTGQQGHSVDSIAASGRPQVVAQSHPFLQGRSLHPHPHLTPSVECSQSASARATSHLVTSAPELSARS